MNMFRGIIRELSGLFVDDGAFALQIVGVVVLAALSAILMPGVKMAAGVILLMGCLVVLFANVACAARGW